MGKRTHYDLVAQTLAHFSCDPDKASAITRWVDTVADWNQRVDMTAARNERELVDLMVADAAILSQHVSGDRLVDVGCGPGAPGLPLALLRPDVHMTLVEPLQKRATLLRLSKGREKATFDVVQGKGEDLTDTFDTALSRATLPPPAWLELGARLATKSVWVLLATIEPPSCPGWEIAHDERYTWPLTEVHRRIVRYEPLR